MLKSYTIQTTSDYSIFVEHCNNRDVKPSFSQYKKLLLSMKVFGFLPFFPLWCMKSKTHQGKLEIQIGHNRLRVAEHLKVPVCYIIYDCDFKIWQEKETTRQWNLVDFLHCQIREGNPVALAIDTYHKDSGISLDQCLSILGGEQATSHNKRENFVKGKFVIQPKSLKNAEKIASIVKSAKKINSQIATNRSFVGAVSKAVFVDQFNVTTFIKKLSVHSCLLTRQTNTDAYLSLIEHIYNRQCREQLPVVFLANQAARARNFKFNK